MTGKEISNKAVSGTLQEVFSSLPTVVGGTNKGVTILNSEPPKADKTPISNAALSPIRQSELEFMSVNEVLVAM